MNVSSFVERNYRHFNAAVVVEASKAWVAHLQKGGKMLVTLGGAMSTAELGITLAELIRKDKVHAISCTGANLEEDMFNLVAHNHYERVPDYRSLTPAEELALHDRGMNRVTDTCIPEDEAIRRIEAKLLLRWQKADKEGRSLFPFEFLYDLIRSGDLKACYQIDPNDSWLVAAAERNLQIFTPGWEDSTTGNIFVAHCIKGDISRFDTVKSGPQQMAELVGWYKKTTSEAPLGFFQIGGGIAGDFPICVVPLIRQDLEEECVLWSYFCQISDSTTSFGSYSGAVPNEKITWGKLDAKTPRFVIESDASIVAPLIFQFVLEN